MKSVALLLGLIAAACAQSRHADADDPHEAVAKASGDESVPLDQVPEAARKAAEAAVPGFTATSAEKEVEHGTTVYSLEGTAGGKPCEVEVTADGKVTEVEKDGDDGDDEAEENEADDD